MKFYNRNMYLLGATRPTALSRKTGMIPTIMTCTGLLLATACGNSNTPLDADTRQRIDSTAAAQIRLAQQELNRQCSLQRTTVLPQLVDSIKQKRLQEIQEKLKTVDGRR